ncbi:MAG: hypothetical protein JSS81_03095 [Acidobacteria bacterium]|nr:hypothetical protein [Acidobacteriota bacterium]
MNNAAEYAELIMADDCESIIAETPTAYTPDRIERIYEFADGAVVKYEWQSTPDGRTSPDGKYNHRFTLVKPPMPNPHRFKAGVIKVIEYPKN